MSSSASSGGDVTASSGYDEWDNAISNLINANYKTDQARNYIQQFVWFEYRNWTNTPPNKQMYRNNALNVSYRKNRSTRNIHKIQNKVILTGNFATRKILKNFEKSKTFEIPKIKT